MDQQPGIFLNKKWFLFPSENTNGDDSKFHLQTKVEIESGSLTAASRCI